MTNSFDVLIIGGGAAGMSCAMILGSAHNKSFAKGKKIGILMHQKASHLQTGTFNNVLAMEAQTKGETILQNGKEQLTSLYPHVTQIDHEKVTAVKPFNKSYSIETNAATYHSKEIVVATGYTKFFYIEGLKQYVEAHQKSNPKKERIQLKNMDHVVAEGIYVAGTLAGWRSQFAIACGSGASVATDILTKWNNGEHSHVHDKIES